jgi:hypothetical protein
MRRPQRAKLSARCVSHARYGPLMQRDVAMRVDEARKDELPRGIDNRVVRGFRPKRAVATADMDDSVALYDNERVPDRVAARPVDQCPVFDQQPRRGIGHDGTFPYERRRSLRANRTCLPPDNTVEKQAGTRSTESCRAAGTATGYPSIRSLRRFSGRHRSAASRPTGSFGPVHPPDVVLIIRLLDR